MESITIHPVNKKQIKALTEIAKAMDVDFHINKEKAISKDEFIKRFENASSIEDSKQRSLKFARSLWEK
jgi:hypothetical protein